MYFNVSLRAVYHLELRPKENVCSGGQENPRCGKPAAVGLLLVNPTWM